MFSLLALKRVCASTRQLKRCLMTYVAQPAYEILAVGVPTVRLRRNVQAHRPSNIPARVDDAAQRCEIHATMRAPHNASSLFVRPLREYVANLTHCEPLGERTPQMHQR